MKTETALDWFNNELDNILELYPSEWGEIQYVFKEAKNKEKEIAENFAIGFAVWLDKNKKENKGLLIEELLEIYKETL